MKGANISEVKCIMRETILAIVIVRPKLVINKFLMSNRMSHVSHQVSSYFFKLTFLKPKISPKKAQDFLLFIILSVWTDSSYTPCVFGPCTTCR